MTQEFRTYLKEIVERYTTKTSGYMIHPRVSKVAAMMLAKNYRAEGEGIYYAIDAVPDERLKAFQTDLDNLINGEKHAE